MGIGSGNAASLHTPSPTIAVDSRPVEGHLDSSAGSVRRSSSSMLLRQTLLYLPSQLAGPAMQFLFAIIWTHWLTDVEYGRLTFLIASQELIFLCCVSWWSLFVLRYFGGASKENALAVPGSEPGVLEATCIPQVLLNLAILASLRELGDLHLVVSSTAYVIGRSFVVYFGERARTTSNIALYTIAQIGALSAGGVLGFLLVALVSPTASSVLTGFAIAHLLVALWLVSKLRIGKSERKIDSAVVRRAFAFGLPLVVAGAVNWFNLNGIRVVMEAMGGATAVGLLAVGWGLGQRLATTAAMFVTMAAFPLAARSLEEGARSTALRQMRHGGTMLVGTVLPAAVGLCLIAAPFAHLVISESFREITIAIMPVAVMTGAIRNIRVHYADMAFILFERTSLSVVVNSVEAVLMVACCAFGYSHDGIFGSVVGACVASTLAAVLAFAIAWRFGLPMPLMDWARIGLAAAAMAAVLLELPSSVSNLPDLPQICVRVGLGILIYTVCIVALFPARVREAAGELFRPASGGNPVALKPAPGKI